MVDFSVRAQDYIVKQQKRMDQSAIGSDVGYASIPAGSVDTTVASAKRSFEDSMMGGGDKRNSQAKNMTVRDHDLLGPLQLPKINAGQQGSSPLKGMLDISVVTRKIKRSLNMPPDMRTGRPGREGSHAVKSSMGQADLMKHYKKDNFFGNDDLQVRPSKRGNSQKGERSAKMPTKVLETWINETLEDAEHLDIPGVILKSEHKEPLMRYGVSRRTLTEAGLSDDLVDRLYRALFVYSVGFYELINKCLEHTANRKYTIIVSIWKVFAILLEYCCRTDYRTMIQKIVQENDEQRDALTKEFEAERSVLANNEKALKQTIEALTKRCEELDKDRATEKAMRKKLEEEFNQNTKNHEEEVQLRLKFESKLNNMHSAHRDLETKFKRVRQDFTVLNEQKNVLQ